MLMMMMARWRVKRWRWKWKRWWSCASSTLCENRDDFKTKWDGKKKNENYLSQNLTKLKCKVKTDKAWHEPCAWVDSKHTAMYLRCMAPDIHSLDKIILCSNIRNFLRLFSFLQLSSPTHPPFVYVLSCCVLAMLVHSLLYLILLHPKDTSRKIPRDFGVWFHLVHLTLSFVWKKISNFVLERGRMAASARPGRVKQDQSWTAKCL